MALLSARERRLADAIAAIGYQNPFLPERIMLERRILGARFVGDHRVMALPAEAGLEALFPNVAAIREQAQSLADTMRSRLSSGTEADVADRQMYEDVVLYLLYSRYMASIGGLLRPPGDWTQSAVTCWPEFEADFRSYLQLDGVELPSRHSATHAFAVFFQIERAFRGIFRNILGASGPMAELRAAVWDSIFTRDMRRYSRTLYRSMHRIPTLILGASGTGKELVANAIAHSQYIPFDPKSGRFGFRRAEAEMFQLPLDEDIPTPRPDSLSRTLNLSALAMTLLESELFGHCRGAFTGADRDKAGWLEQCPPGGAVFLDEIGEVSPALQVKLLRVIQFRQFERVGETEPRFFLGKLITATNRNLLDEIRSGTFREDLYFRLCADQVHTPTLREQLVESPEDLDVLIRHVASSVIRDSAEEADRLAAEASAWIRQHLGPRYPWPGNMRELEQCVRNIMIRNSYTPSFSSDRTGPRTGREQLVQSILNGELTQKELACHYASLAYAMHGTLDAAARRLGVNWRTVKSHLRDDLVERYRS